MFHSIDAWAERALWFARFVIGASLGLVVWFALDREPPFEVLSVYPASAKPGEWIVIEANVRRDAYRGCNAEFSRYIFDSKENGFFLGSNIASAQLIADLERRTPGRIKVSVMVPQAAAPGEARLTTALMYRCNKVHWLYPIEVTTDMQFTILPP